MLTDGLRLRSGAGVRSDGEPPGGATCSGWAGRSSPDQRDGESAGSNDGVEWTATVEPEPVWLLWRHGDL